MLYKAGKICKIRPYRKKNGKKLLRGSYGPYFMGCITFPYIPVEFFSFTLEKNSRNIRKIRSYRMTNDQKSHTGRSVKHNVGYMCSYHTHTCPDSYAHVALCLHMCLLLCVEVKKVIKKHIPSSSALLST